jgi:hypothetical protein
MPLAPKGDPRRPLHLAVRSTRMLGILFVCMGTCGILPMLSGFGRGGVRRGVMMTKMMTVLSLVYFLPGVLYILVAVFLRQRQFCAVVAALVMASIQCLLTLIGLVMVVGTVAIGARSMPSIALIPLGLLVFVIVALAQLIYHLARSFESIKYGPIEGQRGFEPILPPSPPTP